MCKDALVTLESAGNLPDAVTNGNTLVKSTTFFQEALSVQNPRRLDDVVSRVTNEATHAGAEFYYAWTAKGEKGQSNIEGGTIGLALCIFREFGNCTYSVEDLSDDDNWIFNVIAIDFETGVTMPRLFRTKRRDIPGKYDKARKEEIQYQIAQSKAIRNCIFQLVPRWLVKKAVSLAKKAVAQGITKEGVTVAAETAIKCLSEYGVTLDRIESKMGVPKAKWGAYDVAALKGDIAALENREATANQLFPEAAQVQTSVLSMEHLTGAQVQDEPNPYDNGPSVHANGVSDAKPNQPTREPESPAETATDTQNGKSAESGDNGRDGLLKRIDAAYDTLEDQIKEGDGKKALARICKSAKANPAAVSKASTAALKLIASAMEDAAAKALKAQGEGK